MAVVFAAMGSVVFAHHGRAGYAEAKTIKGVVASVEWKNPHVFIIFDVKDDKGNVVRWAGELSSPSTMLAAGMTRTSLKPGDVIEVKGRAGQNGTPVTLISSIMKDGKAIVGDASEDGQGRFTGQTR
jgi:hypothetical protein